MYKELINKILRNDYRIGYDARHIEGYMRLEYSTLDGLSYERFRCEVGIARQCIDYEGREAAESLALSYGL